MAKGEYLGEFEQIVLLALIRLADNAYGMTIRQEIEKRTGRYVSIGAVYATLDRLEKKGYVDSWLADPTAERGGRAKRYFELLPAGSSAIQRSKEMLTSMWEGLDVDGDLTPQT
ncbi:MAG TPA: helix-turn-helix transcriptional regulator [Blastocatellia bacterium]|nr:helix-turn-helix transcriptional regulator [Blastocatellia bacterium]